MTKHSQHQHFEGKTPLEHLKAARKRGQLASESVHGVEPSGAVIAATDACRETVVFLTLLSFLLLQLHVTGSTLFLVLSLFGAMLLIWKTCRSAFWGWSRLEKVHRLIQQEKWEIEHHRAQEKEELLELYQAKGFKDKQLKEVVDVLMADDNRLLQIMLEEELGLSLGSFEHPLRQCLGAAIAVMLSTALSLLGLWMAGIEGLCASAFILLSVAGFISAKELGNDKVKSIVWTLAISVLSLTLPYFLFKTLMNG